MTTSPENSPTPPATDSPALQLDTPADFMTHIDHAISLMESAIECDLPLNLQRELDAQLFAQCDFFARWFRKYAEDLDNGKVSGSAYQKEITFKMADRFRNSYDSLTRTQFTREKFRLINERMDQLAAAKDA